MYITQDIAGRIKTTLKDKGIRSKDMLASLGMGINSISEFAKGKKMSCIALARIADYLDCSVDYLLGRTDIADKHLTTAEAIVTANNKENVLLLNFRNMNTAGQDYILQTVDMAKDKYKKCDSISDGKSIG